MDLQLVTGTFDRRKMTVHFALSDPTGEGWRLGVITILIPVETIRVPVMSVLPMSLSAASRRT